MAGEVIVDALPYYDQGYDEPGVREAAYALVDEETRRYRPTKNYLEHLPVVEHMPVETEVMKIEFERLAARLPMEMLSMKRYELPPPPSGRQNDITAWNECVDNSMAQLEHQSARIANLELMSRYGANAWKLHNEILVKVLDSAQKIQQALRKRIQEINWKRKNDQIVAGRELRQLEESWISLVAKNYEIERVCMELEQEVEELKDKERKLRGRGPVTEEVNAE
ncbi:pre-mRNA-splicing factor SPF27-like [Anneissia japonica]|uniref:pre-mRNA-splicing factor SPF27-like n=1 Tax=Anneissia japonica TaxID=1529436 RepID=UPI0014255519|nr:pre-mRNA-splicing factor SPF27-like [Anneissia japonica]